MNVTNSRRVSTYLGHHQLSAVIPKYRILSLNYKMKGKNILLEISSGIVNVRTRREFLQSTPRIFTELGEISAIVLFFNIFFSSF